MKRRHTHLAILNKLLPKNRDVAMLSAQEVSDIFFDLHEQWQASKISLKDFSGACGLLWIAVAEKDHNPPDILWAELADVLYAASELKFGSPKDQKTSFQDDILFFISTHKKSPQEPKYKSN